MQSLELFCGTGGLALGLQQAGFDHKALIEWDKDSCNNINANIENGYKLVRDWRVIQSDVRDIRFGDFRNVQLVSGGPPCQPFSIGGKSAGMNDNRDMFPQAVRAVREIRPKAFIFENVKGLLRRSFSSYFSYILLQLQHPELVIDDGMTWEEHLAVLEQHYTSVINNKELTYNVVFRLLNAADYGVPQTRHRVVIVGFRSDIDANWAFPAATHSRDALLYDKWITGEYWRRHNIPAPSIPEKDRKAVERLKSNPPEFLPWLTVRDALQGLPEPSDGACAVSNHEYRGGAKSYPGHSGSVLDEPSKTIKAGAHGVPGGENMLVLDDGTQRYYTVREAARIQTFPDSYRFYASWTESMRQIGNAVPVALARIIGQSVYNELERVSENGKKWGSNNRAI